jgi:uncharacterized membrane protein YeiB
VQIALGLGHWWLEHERGMELSASWWTVATIPIAEAGILALSATYVCSVCLLFYKNTRWHPRLSRLAPVGRMALTNHLTQSVLYLVLFHWRRSWPARQSRAGHLPSAERRDLLCSNRGE